MTTTHRNNNNNKYPTSALVRHNEVAGRRLDRLRFKHERTRAIRFGREQHAGVVVHACTDRFVFLEPVDPELEGIPDYFEVVERPMDLDTVERRLTSGVYGRGTRTTTATGPVASLLNGPFKDDMLLVFDNAMLYNGRGNHIYNDAATLRNLTIKRIADATAKAETRVDRRGGNGGRVTYAEDDDSAIDEAYLESEDDEADYDAYLKKRKGSKKRKRGSGRGNGHHQGGASVADAAAAAIESSSTIPSLTDNYGEWRRSPLLNCLGLNDDVATFSLPLDWACRHRTVDNETSESPDDDDDDEAVKGRTRRSEADDRDRASTDDAPSNVEYYYSSNERVVREYLSIAETNH